MNCPNCNGQLLRVAVTFTGDVACRFSDDGDFRIVDSVDLDSTFGDDAACECPKCGWSGEFQQTWADKADSAESPPSARTILEVEDAIAAARQLSGESRQIADVLTGEIRRLNLLLDSLTRISKTSETDTTIA